MTFWETVFPALTIKGISLPTPHIRTLILKDLVNTERRSERGIPLAPIHIDRVEVTRG